MNALETGKLTFEVDITRAAREKALDFRHDSRILRRAHPTRRNCALLNIHFGADSGASPAGKYERPGNSHAPAARREPKSCQVDRRDQRPADRHNALRDKEHHGGMAHLNRACERAKSNDRPLTSK
jgi:hypothetical protein